MSEVSISKTKLRVLSVPRQSFWLFLSAVTELLYNEAGSQLDSCSDLEDEKKSTLSDTDSSWASVEVSKLKSWYAGSIASDNDNHYSPTTKDDTTNNNDDNDNEESDFFHIAFTPLECTIICSETIMNQYFKPILNVCLQLSLPVELVDTSFLRLQLDSEGAYDNCTKILELTEPLSNNGILLYFLSTHFSNIVLIPYDLRKKVITTLLLKNFEFSGSSNSYIFNQSPVNTPVKEFGELDLIVNDTDENDESDSNDLSVKAFNTFKNVGTKPWVDRSTLLLLTGARTGYVGEVIEMTAKMTLRPSCIPKYFAITRTASEEVSLLLPKSSRIRANLGFKSKTLMGSAQDVIVPIALDFHLLPLKTSGIVAGVAQSILHGVKTSDIAVSFPFEMYYLSMAKSAIIMIPEDNITIVEEILNQVAL